jgi:hypothetical protein
MGLFAYCLNYGGRVGKTLFFGGGGVEEPFGVEDAGDVVFEGDGDY